MASKVCQVRRPEGEMMTENLCHRLANESLFVAFATALLTAIAALANVLFWPAVVLVFGARAAYDFSRVSRKSESRSTRALQLSAAA